MKGFKKRDTSGILPLSCNPELDNKSVPGIDAYYSDLNNAFKNSRIQNIAVTGQHGVGKSSLIKSFDTAQRSLFRRNPKFLYVSLGNYLLDGSDTSQQVVPAVPTSPLSTCEMTDGNKKFQMTLDLPSNPEKVETDSSNKQNAVEQRILMQLCAKFGDRYFPLSGFRLIPRQAGILNTFLFVLFAMSILLLFMKQPLAALFYSWKPQDENVEKLIDWLLNYNQYIEFALYIVLFTGAAVIFWKCYKWLCIRGKRSNIALKTTNAEWNLGESASEDYLDQYTQELVYCLSRVGRKIDYTVVFEDMDRLDTEICVPIFTRLREINHILNAHMANGKRIRFVFVIDDEIACKLDYAKFFDFVMPVIPTLNISSAEAIFRENLAKVNCWLEQTIKCERLRSRTGTVGVLLIAYLDRHPAMRELCYTVRSAVRAIWRCQGSVWRRIKDAVLSNINKFRTQAEEIPSVENVAASEPAGPVGEPEKEMVWTKIKRWPVFGHLFRRMAKIGRWIRDWFGRLKYLLTYTEPKRRCNSGSADGLNCDKNTTDCYTCIRRMEEESTGIISMSANALTDYRTMFTILNEYSLSARLYSSNNQTNLTCETAKQILAFYIYKHLWPDDYRHLINGDKDGSVLTGKSMDSVDEKNRNLLKWLRDEGLLSINSLHFAGFSRQRIADIWNNRLKHGDALSIIEDMCKSQYTNPDLQRMIQEYCTTGSSTDSVTTDVLAKTIEFVLEDTSVKKSPNDWLFSGRHIDICLEAISKLTDDQAKAFIERCKVEEQWHIFKKCARTGSSFVQHNSWTEREATIFAWGVHPDLITDAIIYLDDGRSVTFSDLINQ